jgi:hypothetical protein
VVGDTLHVTRALPEQVQVQADPKQTHLRIAGDWPKAAPGRAQLRIEASEGTAFTVVYSAHSAMLAIYALLGDRPMPPNISRPADPKVGKSVLESMLK